MKNPFKQINRLFVLAFIVTCFSCSNDDATMPAEPQNNEITFQDFTAIIDENPTNGQSVGTVQAESEGTLSFSITSQAPAGALGINESTGALTIADATLFDFETNPEITATVSVSNSVTTETATVTISINDINEIAIQDLSVTIDENPADGSSLGTVQVSGNGPFTFSIESQTPAGALNIDASTGELTVADSHFFDFETNPTVIGTIAVAGAESTATVTISLNDLDEVSAVDLTVVLDENPTIGEVVGTLQVSGGGNLGFGIASQTPAGALNINTSTGELTVADPSLFDYETNPVITANIAVESSVNTTSAMATITLGNIDEIGDLNYGGIIFWLDGNGGGLVCDIDDIANPNTGGITWSVGPNMVTGASGTAIGTGQANTTAILNSYGTSSVYAASLCANLTAGGYSDWYLPSLFELHEIYYNMATISATAQANGGSALTGLYHWSSFEMNTNEARVVFYNGTNFSDFSASKNNSGALVRAVRTF